MGKNGNIRGRGAKRVEQPTEETWTEKRSIEDGSDAATDRRRGGEEESEMLFGPHQ